MSVSSSSLASTALGVCLGVVSYVDDASAQTYPTKPVRMIVTLAAGGPVDAVARLLAARLGEQLGQQFLVDNRPGAGGSVGGEAVARAAPDGHTMLMAANGTVAISPHLISTLTYDSQRDLTPISLVVTSPLMFVVHPSLPAKNVKEFIAVARARPGAIAYASSGNGSTAHLAVELLKSAAKLDLVHVPYRGAGPALTDLVAGQTQMSITAVSGTLPFVQSGKLRALGVSSPKRLAVLPELPTIGETVPGYEVVSWYGLLTTAGTPPAVVALLNREVVRAVGNEEVRSRLSKTGLDPETSTPEAFGALIKSESAKWGKLIKALNLKL